tara:strand:+ start:3128 stop:7648 length:4521 start_codon:yes stop_codon:yes gene_type:complete
MAEAKNTFLKSKMNKDLDDRLLPSGEYRNANNVAVSKSEGQDVGALENVLGNTKIAKILPDFELEVISSVQGGIGNEIFISDFLSAATISGNDQRIHVNYEVLNQAGFVIGTVTGYSNSIQGVTVSTTLPSLPFSPGTKIQIRPNLEIIGALPIVSTDKIYLFATNYTDTSASGLANFSSDTGLSIVKANPGNSAILEYNLNTPSQDPAVLVEGSWLNFSKTFPIINSNLLETLLFWTDDRNQPRKINVSTALSATFSNTTQYADGNWGYYKNEDHVSVAKYAPITPIQLWKLYENSGSPTYETTMKDVVSPTLPDNTTANPDYNATYGGDPDFLEDKFVKFSYRLKFDDGEYSLMAPFTQAAYIPKQDGFFLTGDEDATFRSTVVSFMENKVNNISLRIPMPYVINGTGENPEEANLMQCDQISELMKVTEVEILYKESDALAVQVLDKLPLSIIETGGVSKFYEYDYQARKPYRTLPSAALIRVFDKIPPRAKTQEIISNRIVYGNYINKLTPPETLNYNVALSDKYSLSDDNVLEGRTSIVEYPQHTVKNNRNYQVAIILSDRYGRSSTPILSEVTDSVSSQGINYGGSTFYAPYRYSAAGPGVNESTVLDWPGDSIKVLFNNVITSTKNDLLSNSTGTGTPGIHSYDTRTSSLMVPGGWFSYKVVVRQVEQEYYNIYLPGIINGYPGHTEYFGNEVGETAFTTLYSDNINKLPRDLSEVGPEQRQYRSSTRLYGRVTNVDFTTAPFNTQYYPGREAHDPDAIGVESELAGGGGNNAHPSIYQADTNPYLVRLSTDSAIGEQDSQAGNADFPVLAVYETEPVVSRIDIFWETSTSGWLGRLNELILTSTEAPIGISTTNFLLKEDQEQAGAGTVTGATNSPYVTDLFQPINQAQLAVDDGVLTDFQVISASGINRTADFAIESGPGNVGDVGYGFRIKIANDFYYGSTAPTDETYNFSFNVATSGYPNDKTLVEFTESLQNVAPTIDACPVMVSLLPEDTAIYSFTAVNGSASALDDTNELLFYFETSPGVIANTITIAGVVFECTLNGVVTVQSGIPSGSYSLTVIVYDAAAGVGTLTDTCVFPINFGFVEVPSGFTQDFSGNFEGDKVYFSWKEDNDVLSFEDLTNPVGDDYTTATGLATIGGSGSGLTVDIVASPPINGAKIIEATVNNPGSGYQPEDSVTVQQAGSQNNGVISCNFDSATPACVEGNYITYRTKAYNYDTACGGTAPKFIKLNDNEQFVVVFNMSASNTTPPNYTLTQAWYGPKMNYRATSSDPWVQGQDANGNQGLFRGTWAGNAGQGQGLTSNTEDQQTYLPGLNLNIGFQNQALCTRYLMFNTPGEYELVPFSNAGAFVSGPSTCANPDFNFDWEFYSQDGSYDTPTCDGGTPGTSFEYNLSTSTSASNACAVPNPNTGVQVWAQSYLSKYVVEFYTDKELLTPWTPTAGWFTYNQTGRVFRGGVIETGQFKNPNERGNGAYKAYFNSDGTKSGSGCVSCTINNGT